MAKKPVRKQPRRASAVSLGGNSYGKSRVRMVKVSRKGKVHTVREVAVDVALEGDFEAVHCAGDNAHCLPTDTMKNTVYALGKDHPLETIESFAVDLARHFVRRNRQVSCARVRIVAVPWDRTSIGGRAHPHCFTKGSEERQVCEVELKKRGRPAIVGGIEGLIILKSTDSSFAGYPKDELTTLPETEDRILATSLTARWTFGDTRPERADYSSCRGDIRWALVETFAMHRSRSVQHTLYAMGEAALKACRAIDSIRLSMPNKHCLLVNLAPFGMDNRNEVFVPVDEPFGLIEATIERG
ncbi:MAG: urate oxidase [Phycisphaerales bacterium]|nr:urate oxidase [Phycisphaerales bacterium]